MNVGRTCRIGLLWEGDQLKTVECSLYVFLHAVGKVLMGCNQYVLIKKKGANPDYIGVCAFMTKADKQKWSRLPTQE